MFLKEYYTEPSLRYNVEVLDENNNIILEKDDYNGKIYSKGSIELDLAKDLIVAQKEKTKMMSIDWRDLEFEFEENAEISTEEYEDGTHYLAFLKTKCHGMISEALLHKRRNPPLGCFSINMRRKGNE